MKVNSSCRVPIKMWLDNIEDGALEQACNLANLPFAFKHVALMPDCHQGYGMPIGGVLATKDVIVPNAVGVDIGCGMRAVKTSLQNLTEEQLKKIFSIIRKEVPVGFDKHKKKNDLYMPESVLYGDVVKVNRDNACFQMGTLGGGNHFIEIQQDEEGFIWAMIHSGSRNLGFKVANYYHKEAVNMVERYFSNVPKDLAFIPIEYAYDYFQEMSYCVAYAENNRKAMIDKVKIAIEEICNNTLFHEEIDIAHNYVDRENHFGQNVLVHRKGAIKARKGDVGIIPGCQGSNSYIVEGLGNEDSFMSCSHGAGRKMSRNQARDTLDMKEEKTKLSGVLHSLRNKQDLDEAPGAYKDIDVVMHNQKDLVKIIHKLRPLGVIKG